jgi:hypothetical protein
MTERVAKKARIDDEYTYNVLRNIFRDCVYCYNPHLGEMCIRAYSHVFEVITQDIYYEYFMLKLIHTLLYREIRTCLPLCGVPLRRLMSCESVRHLYRPLYWETYKALWLLRVFPRDIIWLILEHTQLARIPSMEAIYTGASRVLLACHYMTRYAIPRKWEAHDARPYTWGRELIDTILHAALRGDPLDFEYEIPRQIASLNESD